MIVKVTRVSIMDISDVETVEEADAVMRKLSRDTELTGMRFDGHNLIYLKLESMNTVAVLPSSEDGH